MQMNTALGPFVIASGLGLAPRARSAVAAMPGIVPAPALQPRLGFVARAAGLFALGACPWIMILLAARVL